MGVGTRLVVERGDCGEPQGLGLNGSFMSTCQCYLCFFWLSDVALREVAVSYGYRRR